MRLGFRHRVSGELSLRRVNLVLAVLILLVCGAVGDVLAAMWRSDDQRASLDAGNIAVAITQDIQRNVELFDLSLLGAARDMENPAVRAAPKDLRQLILFDHAASATYLGQIIVLDPHGDLVASSATVDPEPRGYADRDYFRIHALTANFGLYVSPPLLARTNGKPVIVFSRRITNPDGSFGGVVAGTLLVDYVHQLFRQMKLGPNGSLSLFRNDGSLIMREPYDPAIIGLRRVPSRLFDAASRNTSGEFRSASVVDGVPRVFHFQHVGKLPLLVSVGLAISDIHRDWWWRATLIGSVVLASCLLIVLLNLWLATELRSRARAEAALTALVDKDGLTGLANRRCFDRVIHAEWRRATRQRQPLALLMVDVDHFKTYNDCHGHMAGDDALRHIATCLVRMAGRSDNLAARYGGEEFAVILPGLAEHEAVRVAETIRVAVAALDLSHPTAPLGHLTVSIGCALHDPATGGTVEQLCAEADAALYRSKRSGRNLVSCGSLDEAPMRLAS